MAEWSKVVEELINSRYLSHTCSCLVANQLIQAKDAKIWGWLHSGQIDTHVASWNVQLRFYTKAELSTPVIKFFPWICCADPVLESLARFEIYMGSQFWQNVVVFQPTSYGKLNKPLLDIGKNWNVVQFQPIFAHSLTLVHGRRSSTPCLEVVHWSPSCRPVCSGSGPLSTTDIRGKVGVLDISISHISFRYINTFWKDWYCYR